MSDVAAPSASALGLTDEQQQFVESIRDFCSREFGTTEKLSELTNGFTDPHNHDVARKMAELGWYGLCIPEEYGGSGGSFLDATLFLEEFTHGQAPVGAYAVTLIVVGALNRFGTEEQKQRPARPRGRGRHARDRDVGAGVRLGRGVTQDERGARRTASGC